jgi:phage gpG-like protein
MSPDELASAFGSASVRAGALGPVLEDFAHYMEGSERQNFIAGGRPVAWIPTKNSDPNRYRQPHRSWAESPQRHRATLVNTGQLMDSTTAFVEGGTDVVLAAGGGGQPPAKAPTLQYGARFNMKRRMANSLFGMMRNNRDAGRFVSRDSWRLADWSQPQHLIDLEIVIPPRPYLLFQDEDLLYLDNRLTDFVFETQEFAVAA